jgi:hypothetical protein
MTEAKVPVERATSETKSPAFGCVDREVVAVIFSSMDGAYYLVAQGPHGEGPTVPRSTVGVSVSAVTDFVLITTFGSWQDVSVDVRVLPMPFRQSGPLGWDTQVESEIEVSGSLWLTDMEHDPQGGPEIALHCGRYLIQVRARSIETVRDRPFLQVDGVMEQHVVDLSPIA